MASQKDKFISEMKDLFSEKTIYSDLKYKIIEIKEENIDEYYLTLELENECIIEGIYLKTKNKIKLNQVISECILILDESKSEIQIKYIISFLSDKNIIMDIKSNKEKITKFNLKPEKILEFFFSIGCFKEKYQYENIFIIFKSKNEYILENPISLENYTIKSDYFKSIDNLKDHDFVHLKNFLYNKKREIICINLTTVQKASDYKIFTTLDNYISNHRLHEAHEYKPIEKDEKISLSYLFSKVVLKNKKEKYMVIMDKMNRLIEVDFNKFKDLDLFDLLFITNCSIKKSNKDEYLYKLMMDKNTSLYYSTKELIFDKNISINNFTILDIRIPDFSEGHNFINKIIINKNRELEIKKDRIVYLFKFKNEQFNEIVPFNIICLAGSNKYEFKFFITHNLINNINLSTNYNNEDRCCIDHCFWNFVDEAPDSFTLLMNNKKYEIRHSNSFDSTNRVGFILINVPQNEQTNKIKNELRNKKRIISSQIWYIKESLSEQDYKINQILNIEEAKPKNYLNYKLYILKIKDYSKYENLYSDFNNFRINWLEKEKEIYNYYKYFYKNVYKLDEEEIDSIFEEYNIDFDPDSVDFYGFKIYLNILLFHSLRRIENDNINDKNEIICKWQNFLIFYFKLSETLIELHNKITAYQKIRILSSFVDNFFELNDDFEGNPCKFFYTKGNDLNKKNSYLLALEFNKQVIKNLTEKSALTKGYIQIDS